MSRPVLLGLDVSPSKAGIGAVLDATGAPAMPAIFQELDGPEAIGEVVLALAFRLRADGLEPMVAYIERPSHGARGGAGQLDAGIAVGMWWFALRRCWPHLVIDTITAVSWRSKLHAEAPHRFLRAPKWHELTANDRRSWWKGQAIAAARELDCELPSVGKRVIHPSDDAAEGFCIARACWLDAEAGRIHGLRRAA